MLSAIPTVALVCCLCMTAMSAPTYRLAAFEVVGFEPTVIDPQGAEATSFDLVPAGDLERTPRDYVSARVMATARGDSKAALVLVDALGKEHRGPLVELSAGEEKELVVEARRGKQPISMLRALRLFAEGQAVEVSGLQVVCAAEHLPQPDATVEGPMDDTSIQVALDSLGEDGGVVYIPPGEYVIGETVTIPCDNVTIYGAGKDTILQGVWFQTKPMLLAEGRQDIRITRLHFRSLPLETFRGYNVARYAEKPEDVGRPTLTSLGIGLYGGCRRIRVDHCEIERFGYGGVLIRDGSELCFDHCFFHENFRSGLGYGIVPCGTDECYIEDNNFENHRHGTAGGRDTNASYTARFNRFVKDRKAVPETGWNQVTSHEIDVHSGCKWLYAHDNWVEMKNGTMSAGACLRGNSGWLWNNTFVNCSRGVRVVGASDDVWTWDNTCVNVTSPTYSSATGTINFDEKPEDFVPIDYPYSLNETGWWPGARAEAPYADARPATQFAGPHGGRPLRLVSDE